MHKTRRLLCSAASQSSPSNATIRTRNRSRTPSAGGDSQRASNAHCEIFCSNSKPHSNKCNLRMLTANLKTTRKPPKPSRAAKPNFGSLQNAVVLAPFYTLKKCFQNKLLDLYSFEKTKNVNNKTKKQNLSFEYDIIEMKPEALVKKEGKPAKKPNIKSRSASYCQCKKLQPKDERTLPPDNSSPPKKRKMPEMDMLAHPGMSCLSDRVQSKRRKLNSGDVTPTSLKSERGHRLDLYTANNRFPFAEAHQSSSLMSSRSKCESWETYSDPPSCKEERLHGSLAVSTTSFDSYLEHFDKGSCEFSEATRKQNYPEQDPNFRPKPTAKHLVRHIDKNDSDGEIVDFMDREPQTHFIPSVESNQQWQPLRRQSKTKRKKPESDSAAGYYLRSSSKEKDSVEGSRTYLPGGLRNCRLSFGNKPLLVEIGVQVERNGQEKSNQQVSMSDNCVGSPREKTPEETLQKVHSRQMMTPLREPSNDGPGPTEPPDGQLELLVDRVETGVAILGERSDLASVQLPAGLPAGPFQASVDARQPQDKDSCYIFGARNGASGLGESCEFPFGLKWVFSDDDD